MAAARQKLGSAGSLSPSVGAKSIFSGAADGATAPVIRALPEAVRGAKLSTEVQVAHLSRRSAALAVFLALFFLPTAAWCQAEPPAGGVTAAEAGARYGQARGAGDLCEGLKPSAKVEMLSAAYSGGELEAFNRAASTVFKAWQDTMTCRQGPNECRRAHDLSCAEAAREIGPGGSRLPGLLEVR